MKRKIALFLVAAGVVLQLGIVIWPFLVRWLTLGLGESFLFETDKIHPADMMRGLRTVYAKEVHRTLTMDQAPNIRIGKPLYLTFSTNAQGMARFDGLLTKRPPLHIAYMSGVLGTYFPEEVKAGVRTNRTEFANYSSMSVIAVTAPTGKYKVYIYQLQFDNDFWPQGLPPRAEADEYSRWPKCASQARIRIWRGHAVVEDVLFNGTPSREYIGEMVKLHKDGKRPEQKR